VGVRKCFYKEALLPPNISGELTVEQKNFVRGSNATQRIEKIISMI